MTGNEYHFVTHWRVKSNIEEVFEIIADAPALVRWWPSVYLAVQELGPGNEQGLGKVVDLYTKGWLPYTLRWQFRVTESRYPYTQRSYSKQNLCSSNMGNTNPNR